MLLRTSLIKHVVRNDNNMSSCVNILRYFATIGFKRNTISCASELHERRWFFDIETIKESLNVFHIFNASYIFFRITCKKKMIRMSYKNDLSIKSVNKNNISCVKSFFKDICMYQKSFSVFPFIRIYFLNRLSFLAEIRM